MSAWNEITHFLFGKGFWYVNPIREVDGLTEDQLFWIPDPNSLCALWQVGHIAHRERVHIGNFLQGIEDNDIPPEFEIFGTDWHSVEEIRDSIGSVDDVFAWIQDVRSESHKYIESLAEADFLNVPSTSAEGLSVAHWLYITVAHSALHIGRIQMLRAMIEGKQERVC